MFLYSSYTYYGDIAGLYVSWQKYKKIINRHSSCQKLFTGNNDIFVVTFSKMKEIDF